MALEVIQQNMQYNVNTLPAYNYLLLLLGNKRILLLQLLNTNCFTRKNDKYEILIKRIR